MKRAQWLNVKRLPFRMELSETEGATGISRQRLPAEENTTRVEKKADILKKSTSHSLHGGGQKEGHAVIIIGLFAFLILENAIQMKVWFGRK